MHFITGQNDRKDGKQYFRSTVLFSLLNYLVFLATRIQIQPTRSFVHYYEEPNTFWWNQSKKDPEIQMTLVKSRLVEQMFSRKINHHAHSSEDEFDTYQNYHSVVLPRTFASLYPNEIRVLPAETFFSA